MRLRLAALVLCACAAATRVDAADGPSPDTRGAFDGVTPIVHFRTYYWDSRSTSGSPSEAWAAGGWAGATTPWYGDVLQLGVLGYTSQKLYGPADKGGSQLLGPGQDPISVLGQAYASLRYAGQTFTGYRQLIDQPWVNPQDSRMIPNLFEGYLLGGKAGAVDYTVGYVAKFKARDADSFAWMSSAAGSAGPQRGMILGGARLPLAGDGALRVAEQYLVDAYNTAYVDGDYPIAVGSDGRLRLRGQYGNQQSVGSAGLGTFDTWMYGVDGLWELGPLGVEAAFTQTSRKRQTLDPFGDNPSYLNLMQVAFNEAGEQAWLLGVALDFSRWGARGLKARLSYGSGRGAIDPTTGAALGSRNETDVRLAYDLDKASPLRGLSFGVEGSWLNQAGAVPQARQLRVFANYDVPFDLR